MSTGAEKKPLEGATFKVTRTVDGEEKAVYRDGKEYTLTSRGDGYFTVEDLVPGDYALWEIKAPNGYVKLEKPVRFTVTAEKSAEVVLIENRKKPPIEIPKTGDVQLLLLAAGGVSLVALGNKWTKEDE